MSEQHTKPKILPCPHCGSTELSENVWYLEEGEVDAIECTKCYSGATLKVWNTRSSDPRIALLETQPKAPDEIKPAASDILAERKRQIESEGWTIDHDDEYANGELSDAAAGYAAITAHQIRNGWHHLVLDPPSTWPWDKSWWKPSTARRNLVKAGALIIAEIERLDRKAMLAASKESE